MWNSTQQVSAFTTFRSALPRNPLRHLVRRARFRLPLMARFATKVITATECVKRKLSIAG